LPPGSQTHTLTFTGNTLSNSHSNIIGGRGGVTITGAAGAGQNHGGLTYTISNNAIRGASGNALSVVKGPGSGTFKGSISGNTIGVDDQPLSASLEGSGIGVSAFGQGAHTALLSNNTVYGYAGAGIHLTGRDGNSTFDVTITGNATSDGSGGGVSGLLASIGAVSSDEISACLSIGGTAALQNNFIEGDPANLQDVRLTQAGGSTTRLPGYGGSSTDADQVAAYIRANNLDAPTPLAMSVGVAGGYVGGAACQTP
jgi:hypothetical protein